MADDDRKPFWAKCVNEACGHCWPVAYLPMEVEKMAELATAARCPLCASSRKPVVAKQKDGKLLEDVHG